jgi:hypothetical protein
MLCLAAGGQSALRYALRVVTRRARYQAAKQADEDMRRDEPWLWRFANVVTWAIHPWVSLRVWWLG